MMIDVPMVCDSFIEPLKGSRGDTPKITLRCDNRFSKYGGTHQPGKTNIWEPDYLDH